MADVVEVRTDAGVITGLTLRVREVKPVGGGVPPLPDELLGRVFTTSALAFDVSMEGRQSEGSISPGDAVSGILQHLRVKRGGGPDVVSWIFSVEAVVGE